MSSVQKRRDRKKVNTKMISMIEKAHGTGTQRIIFPNQSDDPPPPHRPRLNEIQIRAYRIHQEHGAVYGGYSLDEWLEAEHELDDELRGNREKKEQVR